MLDFALLLLAAACLALGLFVLRRPARQDLGAGAPIAGPAPEPPRSAHGRPEAIGRLSDLAGSEPGWLRVVDAAQLLQRVSAATVLDHMLRQSRLSQATWQRDLLPALQRYAELVQLMPASEAHHHAHAGGLLSHTLEMVLATMTWRNGCLLPQGATAEDLDAYRDHWTYAAFYAALLHDVGKTLADLRVDWRSPGRQAALRWSPIAGSLVECQASEYLVKFTPSGERDYGAHAKVAMQLLQRIAPASALKFLASQPAALEALMRYLSGDDQDGDLGRLVRRADQASTRRALATGSRARFETAQRQPLIDVLMGALRRMMQRGGELPLNRDGAAGWVSGDSVYFVAKRLADAVREHVRRHLPEEAIPGEDRNDRLFDTWQEYGFVVLNPQTQQAIWHVTVHGEDGEGYSHTLSVLRFPLAKIWDSPELYPAPMRGRVEPIARRKGPSAEAGGGPVKEAGDAADPNLASAGGLLAGPAGTGDAANSGRPSKSASERPAKTGPKLVRAPNMLQPTRSKAAPADAPQAEAAAARAGQTSAEAGFLDESDAAPAAGQGADPEAADDSLLDEEDDAVSEARRRARSAPIGRTVPTLPPVLMPPAVPPLPGAAGAGSGKPPTAGAIAFLGWLQAGLASGELRYNASGAPVHFVPQGMALVSPLIFRMFAQAQEAASGASATPEEVERLGLTTQREVLRAGWHLPAPDGMNIHSFAVRKRGKSRSGKLAAVVLTGPERWVTPVPPPNPALRGWDEVDEDTP